MRRKNFIFLFFLHFFFKFSFASTPGYITAADLTYICKGSNIYEVQLIVYAECDGEIKLENQNTYDVFLKSSSLNKNLEMKVSKISSNEVKYYCEKELTFCNGGTKRGIRRYVYKGTLDLSKTGFQADDWILYWRRDWRTSRMIHVINSQVEPYYVETTINNKSITCNNSPKISSSAIITPCVDSVTTYDLLAVDFDGDELRYSIINPRSNTNDELFYKSGFDKFSPLTLSSPLSINPKGVLTIKATKEGDFGITDILIDEYRNGIKIGSTTRGIQISPFSCLNRQPSISDFPNSSTNSLIYCVGDTIKSSQTMINSIDPDNDNIRFEMLQGLNGWFSYSNGKTASASVNKITKLSDVGKHVFSISAVDDGCPTIQRNTKTYRIEVSQPPVFDLGTNNFIRCDPTTVINPLVTGGVKPFKYEWFNFKELEKDGKIVGYEKFNFFSTEPSISTLKAQKVGLRITDANGCFFEDTSTYYPSLDVKFNADFFCIGTETEFQDLSVTKLGTITSHSWDLDDGGVIKEGIDLKNFNYLYNKLGQHTVTETVTNSVGCVQKYSKLIEICKIPDVDFEILDSCRKHSVYNDKTVYDGPLCSGATYNWSVNDTLLTGPNVNSALVVVKHRNTNDVKITMDVTTIAKCQASITKIFKVIPSPKIILHNINGEILSDSMGKNCNNPAVLAKTIILENLNGGKKYNWNNGSIDSSYTANDVSINRVVFTDKMGCKDTAQFKIVYPVLVDFYYKPVCYPNETMQFINQSIITDQVNTKLIWDYGDGTKDTTSATANPTHKYLTKKNFSVNLSASDLSGCSMNVSKIVFNTSFKKESFRISPDVVNTQICVRNELIGYSIDSLVPDSHIDTLFWDYGNGQKEQKFVFPKGREVKFFFSKPTLNKPVVVKLRAIYNTDSLLLTKYRLKDNYCIYEDSITIKEILPEFKATLVPFRNCATDTAVFKFIKDKSVGDSLIKIKKWSWILSKQNSGNYNDILNPIIPAPKEEIGGESFNKYFNNVTTTDYDIYVQAIDENGCKYATKAPVQIKETALPIVQIDENVCYGKSINVKLGSSNKTPSGLPGIVNDYGMDVDGNTTFTRGKYESSKDTIKFSYQPLRSGDIPLKFYMYFTDNVPSSVLGSKENYPSECRAVIYKSIHVRPAPELNFVSDTVCIGFETKFKNTTLFKDKSSISSDTIITGYKWNFGDDSTSILVNPVHTYKKSGASQVVLSATTKDCSFNYTKNVYVKYKPKADFTITVPSTGGDSSDVEMNIPVQFMNNSIDGSSTNSIGFPLDGYNWNLGDGAISKEQNPIHTYTDIDMYKVTLNVKNNDGCTDSKTKIVDTNSRLDLPSVFSPNGDGKNDGLFLIQKLIVELEEYKIYNRWGQVVFDAGNNIMAVWDGKFNGVDQEVGVYVAHVRAKGKYNKMFEFKKNVTLIR